jgi:hypothetical protein
VFSAGNTLENLADKPPIRFERVGAKHVSSEYSGSLTYVISRLLGGYDYVITHDRGAIDIVVWGKRGEAAVQKPRTAPDPGLGTAAGPQVSDASVDPKTYSTCMALFRDAADCAEMMKRLNGSSR